MKVLLDTHAFVWAGLSERKLSPAVRDCLRDPTTEIRLSVVSAYEIDFKRSVSSELQGLPMDLDDARRVFKFEWLDVTRRHATFAARLPRHHRDPWDRILVAQALLEELILVSVDPALGRYGVPVLW